MDPHGFMQRSHPCFVCGSNNLKITEMGVGGSGKRARFECPDCKAKGTLSNMAPWKGYELSQKQLESIFELAGIEILGLRELVNQYWGNLPDGAHPWWFVKTQVGWISIGWRKRVISIDWSDTSVRHCVTTDEVTKSDEGVHAYSEAKAVEYMTTFCAQMKLVTKPVPTSAF